MVKLCDGLVGPGGRCYIAAGASIAAVWGVSARLVAAADFKSVVGLLNRVPGGFDSHPLPLR